MTPDQIRIAVAECLGWKRMEPKQIDFISYPAYACSGTAEFIAPDGTESLEDWIPNYTASLDACVEFEKTLTEEAQFDYCSRLNEIVRRGRPVGNGLHQWGNVTATALQRCEAYLRVKSKWVEG